MRLIDADALKKENGLDLAVKYGNKTALQRHESYSTMMLYEIADMIDDAPTIEAEPVRRGRWMFIEEKNGYLWKCSNCKGNFDQRFSYCPHCGAKMDGELDKCPCGGNPKYSTDPNGAAMIECTACGKFLIVFEARDREHAAREWNRAVRLRVEEEGNDE